MPQNVRETAVFVPVLAQMLTRPGRGEGSAPGLGVRVMGCARGRGRGKNGYRITLWSAGALPGKILLRLPGACCIIPARICETVRRFSVLLAQPGQMSARQGLQASPPRAGASCACGAPSVCEANLAAGRIYSARGREGKGFPQDGTSCGRNWRDNLNLIHNFGYRDE